MKASYATEKEKKKKIEKILKSIKKVGFKTVSILSESVSAANDGQLDFFNEESLSEEIYEN